MKHAEPARAVLQFAVTGTLALLLLGFLAVTLLRNTGKSEAIRDARQTTRLAGEGVGAAGAGPAGAPPPPPSPRPGSAPTPEPSRRWTGPSSPPSPASRSCA